MRRWHLLHNGQQTIAKASACPLPTYLPTYLAAAAVAAAVQCSARRLCLLLCSWFFEALVLVCFGLSFLVCPEQIRRGSCFVPYISNQVFLQLVMCKKVLAMWLCTKGFTLSECRGGRGWEAPQAGEGVHPVLAQGAPTAVYACCCNGQLVL